MKKTATMIIKVNPELRQEFKMYCLKNRITMTSAITKFMKKKVSK